MKNKFLKFPVIALVGAIMAFGLTCKSKKEPVPDEPSQEDPVQFVTPEFREFTFTGDGVTAYTNVGVTFTPTFAVATDAPAWDVVSEQEQSWLIVTKTDNTFTLSVAANAGDEQLGPATVTVTAPPEQPVVITVGKDAVFEYTGYMPAGSWQAGGIVDGALICNGDQHIAWAQDDFKPFLTWTNPETQQEEWLFDSFIFVTGECIGFQFSVNGRNANQATKQQMLYYLDYLTFAKHRAIDALDKELGATIQRLGAPPRPRRVVVMLPDLFDEYGQRPDALFWGELNGKTIDCTNLDDRIAVAKWWVDEVMLRWDREAYKNIELAAFYFVREDARCDPNKYLNDDIPLINACGEYVRSFGKRFNWIPHYGTCHKETWKALGFDVAYQQPNHFFTTTIPDSRIAETCNFAATHGMSVEFEIQRELLYEPQTFGPRMRTYLDGFEQYDVWQSASVMHYLGGSPNVIIPLSQSTDPALVTLYRQYCSILADRQKRFAIKP